ncbi:MAG TPA: PAS domain-containing protein, partial [Chitinophagaceae bacterium]|nr:PAS domain-containing protein [Chitinophagaceae bacterium]
SGFQETHESFIGLVDEQDRDLVLATSLHTQQTGDPFRIEYHITTPAGERKVIQEYGYGQKDEQGQIVRLFGTAQDITERKQAEEALRQSYERFEYVTRAVFDAIWDWEIEADRTYYGDGYKMIYGWQPDEREADRHSWSRRIHPQDQERVLDRLRDSLLDPGITHWVEEYRFRKENGDYTFVRDRAVILRNPEGRAIRMIGASRDITENRYYQDLDRLEKEILESNASGTLSLITVLEKYLIGMEQLHPGMMCSLLEVRNGRMYNLAAPSLPETYLAAIQGEPIGEQAGSCGTAAYLRRRVVVGDIEQDPRWEKYRSPALRHGLRACWSQPILDEKGDVIVTFASYYRVPRLPGELEENTIQRATHILKVLFENNRRQQAIRESNERYEYVTQATFDAIWDWDLSRDSLYWGEGYGQLFGYRRDQSAGTQAERYRLIHPEDSNRISDSIAQAILDRNRVNWSGEYRYRHAQGTYAYVIDRAVILRDPDGTAIRMIGAVQDITQLKEAELRLLRERNTMRAIIDNIPDYVYVLDAQGRYIVNNKAMVEYLGCGSEADSLGKTLSECIPDDLARRNQEDDRRLIATGETVYNREESVISPDGETQWMLTTKVPLKDETGRITGLVGVTRNVNFIYKRRQEEKLIYDIVGAIGKNDSFNIALADTIRIIGSSLGFRLGEAWVLNPGKTELVRKACWFDARPGETHHFAYQPNIPAGKGLIGHTWESAQVQIWNDIFHNGVFLRAEQAEKAGLTSGVGIPVIFQEEVLAVLVFLNDRPISREDESIRMLQRIALQVGLDLQRKKTEDELNRFFNFAPELLCIAGPDGYFKKVNPAFTRLLGFSEQELTARPFTHFVHPDDLQETIRELGDATRGDMSHSFENRYRTKDGEWKWISWSSSPLLDEDGLVFGYGKDITQAKEAELNLLKFKNVIENSRDGIGIISLETPDVFMNQSFVDMLEYTPRELMEAGGALAVYVDPELGQRMFDSLFAGHYWNGDIQLRSRSGRLIDLYLSAGPVFNTSGKVIAVYGVHTDISPRKRMERELLEYNARIISILESITDGFFSLDRDWVVTYCNKEAEKLLATPKEEILGKNLWERYAEAIPLKFYSEYHRALQENIAVHFEEYYEPVKSWFEVSAYPSATGLSVFFRDVTERRRTEEELRISNERYRIVAQATNDSIWDWDLLTNVVYRPGRRLESSLGYGPIAAEDVDAFWQRHVHPEDWAKVLADRARILENKTLNYWDDEYRFRKPDGSYAIIFDRAYIIRDTGGRAIRMIGASRDITRERQQVIEITRIQQNLAALINSTSDLIWSLDADFRIITCNRAYSHLIQGFTGSPVREGDAVIQESFGSELVDRWRRFYQRALDGDSYSINEQLLEPRSGTMVDYIISFTPMTTPDGQVYGVACYAKDVTELVRSARQLEELNQRLRQQALELAASNKELEQFAYVASHDLQEPLRMVSSFLELIDKKYTARLDDTGRQYIRFAVNGAERMKQLIQNLLEFSRLGSAPEELADTDMNSVLDQVLETFRGRIQALGAQVESNRLPVLKRARKSQMLQLLQNLVSNALKYHGEAPPLVRIHAEDQGDHWLFSVADNGIGIDPKYAEKIFVIFQRLHNSTEYSGTGIGLSTCRKIVERHGGRIWVESEPGRGSTFYFTLPKQIPDRT